MSKAKQQPQTVTAIDWLVEYFNGPNVAKNSIYLQMPARAEDARDFFAVRSALGLDGYLDDAEAKRRLTDKLRTK